MVFIKVLIILCFVKGSNAVDGCFLPEISGYANGYFGLNESNYLNNFGCATIICKFTKYIFYIDSTINTNSDTLTVQCVDGNAIVSVQNIENCSQIFTNSENVTLFVRSFDR